MARLARALVAVLTVLSIIPNYVSAVSQRQTTMASNGYAVIASDVPTDTGANIYARIKDPSGNWGDPVLISAEGINSAQTPVVAIIPVGTTDAQAVVIWSQYDMEATYLFAAMLPSVTGSWTAGVQISSSSENITDIYELSMSSGSSPVTALATWTSYDSSGNQAIRCSEASTIDSTNTWSTAISLFP